MAKLTGGLSAGRATRQFLSEICDNKPAGLVVSRGSVAGRGRSLGPPTAASFASAGCGTPLHPRARPGGLGQSVAAEFKVSPPSARAALSRPAGESGSRQYCRARESHLRDFIRPSAASRDGKQVPASCHSDSHCRAVCV
jgi:hypothetical protein